MEYGFAQKSGEFRKSEVREKLNDGDEGGENRKSPKSPESPRLSSFLGYFNKVRY